MSLTFIGVLLLLIGLPIIVYGRIEALIPLLLGCTILGGGAALSLPALGGSSIPPIHFALLLAGMRIFITGSGQSGRIRAATVANWPLLAFAAYGCAIAAIGPRLFRGQIALPRLRTLASYIYATEPLFPTSQNLTISIYLMGTALCAIMIHVACSARSGPRLLVKTAVVIAWINIALAIMVAAARNTAAAALFDLFRNGNYAQLDQQYGSFIRLSALFPEPSTFATYCFGWFVFLFECWFRDIVPRRTGVAAFALFALLLASTSSSAYVSLTAYGVLLAGRMMLPGAAARSDKLVVMFLGVMAGAMLAAMTFFVLPAAGRAFIEMVQYMTIAKGQSYSGLQRAFWARKGLEAFGVSHWIGVGPGSFRSSSLLTAILGCTGAPGLILMLIYLARVVKPGRASTYAPPADERTAIGVAASWAALMLLVPYSATLPTCDPGTDFAIFCGAAMALRASSAVRRQAGAGVRAPLPFAASIRPSGTMS